VLNNINNIKLLDYFSFKIKEKIVENFYKLNIILPTFRRYFKSKFYIKKFY